MKRIINISIAFFFITIMLVSCHSNDSKEKDKSTNSITKSYSITSIKQQALPTTLRLPAQLNAFEIVDIYPKVNGYVKEMLVDMGSKVKQGQVLMIMEAPEVEQNSISAYEKYNRTQAAYVDSRDNYSRLLKAAETKGAVSPNDLQMAQSKMQSDSAWSKSEKANWQAMETMKDYLVVKAPFNGTITQRNIHPGALVTIGNKGDAKPMLELKQTTKLRLQVNVPETYAPQLGINQTVSFTVEGLPGKTFTGTIARQANSVDDKFRNETIEVDVLNTDNTFMPGMYAEVLLPMQGHDNAFIVPQIAVVTSTEKKFVVKVIDNKANIIDVQTGNEGNGMIEVFGNLSIGDSVIVNASDDIKQGQLIR
jgi:membrane fusion protein (multidrug efflux system)